jgi:glycine cleavage system aminomethyltransferase T
MAENKNYRLVVSPFVPDNLFAHAVYVSPEGNWRSLGDGTWPAVPFAYTTWEHEELSWHDTSYIHAGLNPFMFNDIKGKDFMKALGDLSVSSFNNFPIGKARHTILCNKKGKVLLDGIVVRRSENEFITMCLPDLETLNEMSGNKYNFVGKDTSNKRFFYQLCGPRSLEIVEAAAREDLHDIKFMYSRDANIAGKDIFVLRTGMAGTLGYEVHGKIEDALVVYNALMEAGKPYGITEIGRHAYRNTHTEGSIPQASIHYAFAFPGFGAPVITGSLDPNSELVYRSPIELGWEKMINFNHDFVGKAALKREIEGHHNTMVHLIWDTDDVMKVIHTAFEKGNSCDTMDMAEDFDYVHASGGFRMDEVYDGGKMIGVASGRMLSSKNREMLSLCTIDQDYAVEGKIVEVLWGNRGTRQMRIKAKVMLFPYIKEGRNDNFDVESIPHPKF